MVVGCLAGQWPFNRHKMLFKELKLPRVLMKLFFHHLLAVAAVVLCAKAVDPCITVAAIGGLRLHLYYGNR